MLISCIRLLNYMSKCSSIVHFANSDYGSHQQAYFQCKYFSWHMESELDSFALLFHAEPISLNSIYIRTAKWYLFFNLRKIRNCLPEQQSLFETCFTRYWHFHNIIYLLLAFSFSVIIASCKKKTN